MNDTPSNGRKKFWIILIAASLLAGVVIGAYFAGLLPTLSSVRFKDPPIKSDTRLRVELVTGKDVPEHTLLVPEDVRLSLSIRRNGEDIVAVAEPPKEGGNRPLVLSGSTMFDPATLHRVRARFIGKIVSMPMKKAFRGNTYDEHILRSGDDVEKGDLLAIVESIDVGMKKNDLIDALVSMKLDKQVQETADNSASIPLILKLVYRQKVEADQNAINRALQSLQAFELPKEDIDAVYKEADDIIKTSSMEKRDTRKDPKWARVELRAPDSGTIVECNIAVNELIQDNTQNLFQIAKVKDMLVQINAHEDELRSLMAIKPEERKWMIRPYEQENAEPIFGYIDEIGLLIDANQHTIPLRGRIANKEKLLRGGQFVTATIKLDPPPDVLDIPASAVVDDGKEAIVFVQDSKNPNYFSMRRVQIVFRFGERVFVSSKLSEKEMELTQSDRNQGLLPKRPLKDGDRLITAGLLELKKELEDREADQSSE